MLIIKTKRYEKKHVFGGAGIFDMLSSFLKRLITSNAAMSLASEVGKSAFSAGKELVQLNKLQSAIASTVIMTNKLLSGHMEDYGKRFLTQVRDDVSAMKKKKKN